MPKWKPRHTMKVLRTDTVDNYKQTPKKETKEQMRRPISIHRTDLD